MLGIAFAPAGAPAGQRLDAGLPGKHVLKINPDPFESDVVRDEMFASAVAFPCVRLQNIAVMPFTFKD